MENLVVVYILDLIREDHVSAQECARHGSVQVQTGLEKADEY